MYECLQTNCHWILPNFQMTTNSNYNIVVEDVVTCSFLKTTTFRFGTTVCSIISCMSNAWHHDTYSDSSVFPSTALKARTEPNPSLDIVTWLVGIKHFLVFSLQTDDFEWLTTVTCLHCRHKTQFCTENITRRDDVVCSKSYLSYVNGNKSETS